MSDGLAWSKEHKTQQDEDFDRLAAERIARLRQRLDQYNEAIADATSGSKRAGSQSAGRAPPAGGPLAPPTLSEAGVSASRPRVVPAAADSSAARSGASEKSLPPSMASTDFEIEMHPPSTRSHTQQSSAEPARDSPSVRTRTTVRLDPQFEEVEDTAQARKSFGVVPPPRAAPRESSCESSAPRDVSQSAPLSSALPVSGDSDDEESPPGRPSFVVHTSTSDVKMHRVGEDDADAVEEEGVAAYASDNDDDLDDEDVDDDDDEEDEEIGGTFEADAADGAGSSSPTPPPAPITEEEYHAWERAVRCAEEYAETQDAVDSSSFEMVDKWLFTSREVKKQRDAVVAEERLMQSREEETRYQIDEVVTKAADITERLRRLQAARDAVDNARFAEWEAEINAKKTLADERMVDLQRDIALVDRRRAHIHAMEAHNEAKQRAIGVRESNLLKLKRELDDQTSKLDVIDRDVVAKEDRVARWTDILDRREATVAAREAAMRRAQHAHENAAAMGAPPPPPRFREGVRGPAAHVDPLGSADGIGASSRFTTAPSRPLPAGQMPRAERLFSPTAPPGPTAAREEINLDNESPDPEPPR